MNMKKTMAAIAAGAVAVSAMATTVSALDAKTLTYNLVESVKSEVKTGVVTSFYSDVEIKAGDEVRITTVGSTTGGCIVTISGSYYDDAGNSTKTINPTVFTNRDWETVWNPEGDACCSWSDTVKIPVVAQKAGTAVALVESSRANIQVKVEYKDLPASITWDGALTAEIKAGLRGIKLEVIAGTTSTSDATTEEDTVSVVTNNSDLTLGGTYTGTTDKVYKYEAGSDATQSIAKADGSAATGTLTGTYTGTEDMTLTYTAQGWATAAGDLKAVPAGLTVTGAVPTAAATGTLTDANSIASYDPTANTKGAATLYYKAADTSWHLTNASGAVVDPADYGVTITGIPADTNTLALTFTAGTEADVLTLKAAKAAAWDSDPTADGITVTGTPAAGDMIIVTITEGDTTPGTTVAAGDKRYPQGATPITGTASGVGDATTVKQFPYVSYLSASYMKGDDIISNITKSDGTPTSVEEYNAIKAVINDAVVNYSDVTFVFNTATKNVKFEWDSSNVAKEDSWGYYTDDGATNGKVTSYSDSSKATVTGYYQVNDYKSFGRHYWDTEMGYDPNTIYINNDWLGNNLFEGALVINDGITLSLAATDKFDWTGTSLSFSWDAIQDTALTQNQYANYIHNMVLKTSTTWYWDNFQVVLGATEDEDVGTTSPVEAEDEELEETEDEPEVEDEPEDEPEEEPADEPEDEPVEVTPAANPGTGNAPVALAVIPVALAAAAIVAKKRG